MPSKAENIGNCREDRLHHFSYLVKKKRNEKMPGRLRLNDQPSQRFICPFFIASSFPSFHGSIIAT